MNFPWLILSFVFIFLSSIIDNARGPLLPHLTELLGISYKSSSLFFVAANVAAALTGIAFIPVSRKLGMKKSLYLACALGLLTSLFAFATTSVVTLLFFGALIGTAVNLLNSLANICGVSTCSRHKRSQAASLVNTFYGFGAVCGPFLVGIILKNNLPWTLVYTPLAAMFALLLIILFCAAKSKHAPHLASKTQSLFQAGSSKAQKITGLQWFFMIVINIYTMGEILTCVWMSTYLTQAHHYTVNAAAFVVTGFFSVFTLTRLIGGFYLNPKNEDTVLIVSLVVAIAAIVAGMTLHPGFLALSGMMGPVFPILYGKLVHRFEAQTTQLTLTMFTILQIWIGVSHFFLGQIVDVFGIEKSYITAVGVLVITLGLYFLLRAKLVAFSSDPAVSQSA